MTYRHRFLFPGLAIYGPRQSRYYRQEIRKATLLKQPPGHFLRQKGTRDNSPRPAVEFFSHSHTRCSQSITRPKGHRYPTHLQRIRHARGRNTTEQSFQHIRIYLIESSWTLSPLPRIKVIPKFWILCFDSPKTLKLDQFIALPARNCCSCSGSRQVSQTPALQVMLAGM